MCRARNGNWFPTALAAAISALTAMGGAPIPMAHADEASATVDSAKEIEIESLIRDWFSLISATPADSRPLQRLSREPTFEVSLIEGNVRTPVEVEAWLAELRAPQSSFEFSIESIRIVPEGEGLTRARFEVERRARGADDALHIVRWDQTWWLRAPAEGAMSVVRIEQRPALPFPGTGPRIVCD